MPIGVINMKIQVVDPKSTVQTTRFWIPRGDGASVGEFLELCGGLVGEKREGGKVMSAERECVVWMMMAPLQQQQQQQAIGGVRVR